MCTQNENSKTLKNLGLAMGAAAVMGMSSAASADQNPFAVETMQSGYMQLAMEGKCGEGKCGNMKGKDAAGKKMEGKCGNMKDEKSGMEGKCGNMKKEKKMEGKCGEGKCGNMS